MNRARRGDTKSTRDLILDAAERRFAERGFAGVSVRQIASDAGLRNQASLYHHFKNKRALYEAVIARGITPIIELVVSNQTPTDPSEGVLATVDYLTAHPHLPRLIQRAGLDDSRQLRSIVTRILGPLYTEGLSVLAETGRDWSPAEMPYLAVGLYHLIFGYFANAALLEAVLPENPHSETAVARQRQFLKRAMSRLLGNEPVMTRKRREAAG